MAELPEGYQPVPEEAQKKAKTFFDKGRTVADSGQFEYAIDMFIQGLGFDPDSVEAHKQLRDIALKRKVTGGKDLGMFEKGSYKDSKDDKASMLNRERLLAYDPGNSDHMLALAQRAYAAGYYDTVMWIAPMAVRAMMDSGKPNAKKLLDVAGLFKGLQEWDLAQDTVRLALQLRPDDMDLAKTLKDLGANAAMRKGNYATGKNFRDSVKDAGKQQELMEADKDIRSVEGMAKIIEAAEREYATDPLDTMKLMKLVDALAKTDDSEYEARAIDKLEEAYKRTGLFRFRQRIGDINIRQMIRMERSLRDQSKANPSDELLKKDYHDFRIERITKELEEFQLLADTYPTETKYKFEAAVRYFALARYDEAIPALQNARQDPKFKADASLFLGRAFYETQFLEEANETLDQLITDYQLKGDEKSKEMYYWRGRVLEAREIFDQAIRSYSQVAQWDFNYKDVQKRIKELRARPKV